MTRLIKFVSGEYFHVYNRGTNKMQIFLDRNDYSRFQKLLYLVNSKNTLKYSDIETSPGRTWTVDQIESLVDIGSYCLMPNHFHILIKSKSEKETGLFLQRLLTSYSMYFNKKYNRTGSLFQGKSKAEHLFDDRYLKYIFSYIHLNPVKLIQGNWKESGLTDLKKAVQHLNDYNHSSYKDFIGENRSESKILNKVAFPDYFSTPKSFSKEMFEWLNYEK